MLTRQLLSAAIAVASSTCWSQTPLPTRAHVLSMFTAYEDQAEALAIACKTVLTDAEIKASFGQWLERNKSLLERIQAAGTVGLAPKAGRSPQQVWRDLRTPQKVSMMANATNLASPEFCKRHSEVYQGGLLELRYFPVHLRVIGITD